MKTQEPKDWYKNQIKRWSARIENRIYDFYTFDEADKFGQMYSCSETIQYKAI